MKNEIDNFYHNVFGVLFQLKRNHAAITIIDFVQMLVFSTQVVLHIVEVCNF